MTYKLTAGPAAGKSIFFAENCVITVNVGDIVDANTKICDLHGMFTAWSESGWAVNGRTAAKVVGGGYSEGQRTAMGQNFSDFMKSIGDPKARSAGDHSPVRYHLIIHHGNKEELIWKTY